MTASTIARRVSVGDVDHTQIFFNTYFRWMQEAFEEVLRQLGQPVEGHRRSGVQTAIVSAHCDYVNPAVLGDEVEVFTWIDTVGTTSFRVEHEFYRGDVSLARGHVTYVCVGPTNTAVRVPGWLRDAERVLPVLDVRSNRP